LLVIACWHQPFAFLVSRTAAAESVEKEVVSVEDVSGRTSDVLLERMTASIQVVAVQLFLDRESSDDCKSAAGL
jgi:hypothetical protein